MNIGLEVREECVEIFTELKLHHKYKFMIFKISDDDTSIFVEKVGPISSTFDQLVAELPSNECRYAIFDYAFEKNGRKRSRIVLITWAPDDAIVKYRTMYSASKDSFKQKMVGISTDIQATDLSELTEEIVLRKVLLTVRF
ncbi:cofilin/actin-depolymerizing factor [Anaeramoeba ignava]|uniref:Cofilin/actin-depolymerizing factor n=1 Tax=Anaeramoeba ignava TaxID=1746090 RepID=A0A9Q0R893_ANAIG|nr:cofilin/actin-depolymerizing factor [Anaeramoeba ignava]|eukprot:Anaeramoba_ignava/a348290_37.p2 GENE.a348290_37~~a348290_37.p2  ORF type:complete len:141 (+),score=36.77 a348290_37:1880-2302(+)